MKRIDTTNRAQDLFGAGKDGFKDGNIALGQLPTEFNAAWVNGVQEELLNIIEAAGIAPLEATRNQVLLALRAAGVFTTPAVNDNTTKAATTAFVRAELLALGNAPYDAIFGRSLGTNGYQRLPGGLILQWGNVSTNVSGVATVTLPIAFPNMALGGFTNDLEGTASAVAYAGVQFSGLTTIVLTYASGGAAVNAGNVYWFALGN